MDILKYCMFTLCQPRYSRGLENLDAIWIDFIMHFSPAHSLSHIEHQTGVLYSMLYVGSFQALGCNVEWNNVKDCLLLVVWEDFGPPSHVRLQVICYLCLLSSCPRTMEICIVFIVHCEPILWLMPYFIAEAIKFFHFPLWQLKEWHFVVLYIWGWPDLKELKAVKQNFYMKFLKFH